MRKIRWALAGRGKSAGARVIYYFVGRRFPVYLIDLYAKNERVSLTAMERKRLREIAKAINEENRRHPHAKGT